MIGKRMPNGKIKWFGSAASALSALLSPKTKPKKRKPRKRKAKP